MKLLQADMDAAVLSVCGLLVAAGIVLHVWARLQLSNFVDLAADD